MLKIVIISDTHNRLSKMSIPSGDILLHCGDATGRGTLPEIAKFNEDLGKIKNQFTYGIVFTAGNHDFGFQTHPSATIPMITNAVYLQDSMVTVAGLKIYGSPFTPDFYNWSFNLPRGRALQEKWAMIPDNLDILMTHGPPFGYGDMVARGERVGCYDLMERIKKVRPKISAYGHIHEDYGTWVTEYTTFINAASCDLYYDPINPPVVIDVEPRKT